MAQKSSELPKKKNPLPESLFNIDLYYNLDQYVDYEFLPIHFKVVIGSKNTGILIGSTRTELSSYDYYDYYIKNFPIYKPGLNYSSSLDGFTYLRPNIGNSIRLGYQRSLFSGIYANASMVICSSQLRFFTEDIYYAPITNYPSRYYTDVFYKRLWAMRLNAGIGYTLSIGKQKRFYLNSEIVYSFFNRIFYRDSLPLPIYIYSSNFNINLGFGFRIGSPSKTTYDGIKEVNTVPLKR